MLRITKKDLKKFISIYVVRLSDPKDPESPLQRYYFRSSVERWMRSVKTGGLKLKERGYLWLHTVFETESGNVVVAEWTPPMVFPRSGITVHKGGWHVTDTLTTWEYRSKNAESVLLGEAEVLVVKNK